MSRQGAGKPEFRLRFDYPYLEVERIGAPPQRVPLAVGDATPALRAFAADVARTGGRLTAELPETEVWRGRVASSEGAEVARRAAAAALGAAPQDMRIALGPVGADGLRSAAAARRDTLREARAFLARTGLKPQRITGAGAFPGFDGPPDFSRIPSTDALHGRAAGACGLAAALALLIWAAPWRVDAPAPDTVSAAKAPLAAPVVQAEVAQIAPPVEPQLATPSPRARPANLAPVVAATARAVVRPQLVPVSLAARNAPADVTPPTASLLRIDESPLPRPSPEMATPVPAAQAARPADGSNGPLPRPPSLGMAASASTTTAAVAAPRPPDSPRPRPAVLEDVRVASLGPDLIVTDQAPSAPSPRAAAAGPMPRPASAAAPEPVKVAALAPAAAVLATAATLAPEPRRIAPVKKPVATTPAKLQPVATAKPKPVAVAAPAPVRAQPAPVRVRATAQPKPVAKTQTVRLKPQPAAPVRTAVVAAAPVRTAALAPVRTAPRAQPAKVQRVTAQPARVKAQQPTRAQSRQPGLRANSLALIGIFGGADGKHALVQLPNGATERVRAGDQLQGVQITAIAADGVHLRAQGRETVLRLPD